MASVFINEIHYDNAGTDTGEAIEIAGPAGTNLGGWSLVLYNGSGGAAYNTLSLNGVIPDQQNGFGTLFFTYPVNGIQNGSPDGIALVDNSNSVVQFLSYEGTFTAVDGPANGMTSTDIGVLETGSSLEPPGLSLQLTGTGDDSGDFTWRAPTDDSFSAVNTGQTFTGGGGDTPIASIAATDAAAAEAGPDPGTFTISRTGDTSAALEVNYTVGGQATNGTDYTPTLNGTVTIAADESSVDITITPEDDGEVEGNETVTLTLVDTDGYALGTSNSATVTIADNDVELTPIYEIQGAAQTSPLVGQSVTTSGIVTAVDSNGFYLQDPTGDGEIATSDAIFVFTASGPTVSVGNQVQVEGTVSEFTPGGASTGNLSTTQIGGGPTITTLSTGNALPASVTLGAGGRVPPSENIDDDAFNSFDPTTDGIDFFESLEAMQVTAQDLVAVAGTNDFGEIFAVVDGGDGASGLSTRGTLNISPNDFNPERIQIDEDTGILPSFAIPQVDTGASLGDVTGVISYDFGNFQIQPTATFTATDSGIQPETSTLTPTANQLAVATYNVLNLDPNDSDDDTDVADGRFSLIAGQIANNLNAPDIIGLQEVQDNDGSSNTSVTAANVTLEILVNAITAAGGPTYEFIDNPFIGDDTNGGEPGGNIRTAFLYNPERVDLVANSIRTVTEPSDQQTNPGNPFFASRLPLAADFQFNGQTITVVDNHFSSKGGSAPILGIEQPFDQRQEDPTVNGSLDQRREQAQAVNDFVDGVLADDADANVAVLGDLNEFEFVSPLQILAGTTAVVAGSDGQAIKPGNEPAVLTNLINNIAEDERYSFIFQGNSQELDHILVSDSLNEGAEIDIVHVNNEFAETDQRASDHDPVLAQLTLETPVNEITGTKGRDFLQGTDGNDLIRGLAGSDRIIGGAGDDTIIGGLGIDRLSGGPGSDTFVFEDLNERIDYITDFAPAEDLIDVSQIFDDPSYGSETPFEDYISLSRFGSSTLVQIDPNGDRFNFFNRTLVVLGDVAPSNLSANNFIV